MKRTLTIAAAALLALAGCGRSGDNEGGLSAEDARQLNNAAEMLDTSPDSLVATDNSAAADSNDAAMDAVDEDPTGGNAEANNAQ